MSSLAAIKHYDVDLNGDDDPHLIQIALDLRPAWSRDLIKTCNFNGGISNKIVACYLQTDGVDTGQTLLFRIYGKNTDKFIRRDEEMVNMKLCKANRIGPDVYCKYNNGVCYEYLPGHIVNSGMMLEERVYTQIAQMVAKLHSINFDPSRTARDSTQTPFIFAKIRELIGLVKDDYATAGMRHMTAERLKQIPSKKALAEEVDTLEQQIGQYARETDSYLTFSHNDLLLGNIVYHRESDTINFIDYEYGGLNYQAYDLANHFNEFAGVEEPNYALFPDKSYQLKWIRIYLDAFFKFAQIKERAVTDELVERYYCEVSKFTLTSHMMWAVWSLVQAQYSQIDFDFVTYAKTRFDEYFKNKSAYLAL